MRNPIHKRLENLETWQHITFMACLCERMLPNFQLFCQVVEQEENGKLYQNILNLVWEHLTVKGAKINFENQLEKLENIIPDLNEHQFYGALPAADACEALSELLHTLIAGSNLEQAIKISQLSLQTVATFLEQQAEQALSEKALKESEEIQQELDLQWLIYRTLNACEKRDIALILDLKNELRSTGISNIGIETEQ
ncbi:TPA: YjaG family protein [Pasteurella multocida]